MAMNTVWVKGGLRIAIACIDGTEVTRAETDPAFRHGWRSGGKDTEKEEAKATESLPKRG